MGDKPGDDDRRSNRLDHRNRSPPFADPLIDLAVEVKRNIVRRNFAPEIDALYE